MPRTTVLSPKVREFIPQVTEIKLPGSYLDTMEPLLRQPYPFLLDSALVSPEYGRYTFMGSHPFMVISSRGDRIAIEKAGSQRTCRGNPWDLLDEVMGEYAIIENKTALPFVGGAVGYLGYDLGRFVEKVPEHAIQDLDFPDMVLALYPRILAIDHQEKKTYIVELMEKDGKRPKRITFDTSMRLPEATAVACGDRARLPADTRLRQGQALPGLTSNFTKKAYLSAIARAKDYIAAGDIYQVNLSQRFHVTSPLRPWEVFKTLRQISPAPYSAYVQFGDRAVISSSPEQFIEVRHGNIVTRPIKGTRRRGSDAAEDEKLRQDLLLSPKDDAELAMIVDLERNDLGRICGGGTVRVAEAKKLEEHPTVFHLSATVEGTLPSAKGTLQRAPTPSQILKAVFPGGSVTGAPKIRAMEIIEELEPTRRLVYTGAIGYIGFDGSMNWGMAIRTILTDGHTYYAQAGGAIVADSDPEAEYEETQIKASAMLKAIQPS